MAVLSVIRFWQIALGLSLIALAMDGGPALAQSAAATSASAESNRLVDATAATPTGVMAPLSTTSDAAESLGAGWDQAAADEGFGEGRPSVADRLLGVFDRPPPDPFLPSPFLAKPTLNLYGVTGLIDTPTAEMQREGTLSMTVGQFADRRRISATAQLFPWLEATFRYSQIGESDDATVLFDRSFDVKARVLPESDWRPAVVIGLQDFLGTSVFSGEYVVASKHLTRDVVASFGVGWGRFASGGELNNPFTLVSDQFETRVREAGPGGEPNPGAYFRGPDVGLFGGVSWATPLDGLTLKLEYSSDSYEAEERFKPFAPALPVNIGVEYAPYDWLEIGGYYMRGEAFALRASFKLDLESPSATTDGDIAPLPIAPRPAPPPAPPAEGLSPDAMAALSDALRTAFKEQGLVFEGVAVGGAVASLRFANPTYPRAPKAFGRAARILAAAAPAWVDVFELTLSGDGAPLATLRLNRADLEALDATPRASERLAHRADLLDAPSTLADGFKVDPERFPAYAWEVAPDLRTSFFDPDEPFRFGIVARASGSVTPAPGFALSATLTKQVYGNLWSIERESDSVLPRVRSEFARYFEGGDPALEQLQADYFFKPTSTLFGRVSAGYFETMFAGVGAELLYRAVDTPFAVGLDINYVAQRDYEIGFELQDYQVLTGHLSFYGEWREQGLSAQVDIGRYLAGDWGVTLGLNRRFVNGWEIGAFATFTDVPFDEFGEGSFDKGILLSIPLDWFVPYSTPARSRTVIRPVTRDGGQRLAVGARLYERVRDLDRGGFETYRGGLMR